MSVVDQLVRARETYEQRDWARAFATWSDIEPEALTADDLAGLATAAYLLGNRAEAAAAMQRCFHLRVAADDAPAAARTAFWLAVIHATGGEPALAGGWTARAQRLLENLDVDVVERGYVLVVQMFAHVARGEFDAVAECAEAITDYGRRFDDADLLATGLSSRGRIMVELGQVPEGLALFDEAMVCIGDGGGSPILAGEAYCTMIEGCQQVSDLGRAAEWTAALDRWCDAQPGLVAFTGQCAVHRGQIMRLRGAYEQAIEEFIAAASRYRTAGTPEAAGLAAAERGDVLRILGRYTAADEAYEEASSHGFEPQPGLALLWLARDRRGAARAAMGRLLIEADRPVRRAQLLPAAVQIYLADNDLDDARAAARELDELAAAFGTMALRAAAGQSSGQVELEDGDPAGALPYLRKSMQLWSTLGCPFEVPRVRVLIGRACTALGDEDSSVTHYDSARRTFVELDTTPQLDALAGLTRRERRPDGLTDREIEVLGLVAAGKSNAQIASALTLSEKTVARHLSNIFAKIDVQSRTAAAAYAFEHGLS